MGCAGCGSSANGKPAGCNSNGNCSSGGCNRLNVFNWLSDIPISDLGKPFPIMEVSFSHGSRKEFFRNNSHHIFSKGEYVVVEGSGGFDIGEVSLTGELVKWQMKKKNIKEENPNIKKVLRPAGVQDIELFEQAKSVEKEILVRSRAIARSQNLEMKITEVEVQADGKKIAFYYTADGRVDFRELIKIYASEFKAKIEMRQIGARQESAKIGGIGSCGRELCCSTWLTDFKTVNTTAARYQNLSINQAKLSGQCGRLKCCLNFELDTYMDALKNFPQNADKLEMATGLAYLQKKDIFRNLMWYSFSGSNKQYPLTIERVNEILVLNGKGVKPEDLEATEVRSRRYQDTDSKVDMGFVNDVGQISLNSLSHNGRRKKGNRSKAQNAPSKQEPKEANRRGASAQPDKGKNVPSRPDSRREKANAQGKGSQQHSGQDKRQNNRGNNNARNRPNRPEEGGTQAGT
ncbi:MAG TPA: regulatory iron-sulfur-containing complex subunit RicT [Edaphocola sp.]|nr:regulatory iron-sulfur-containing complex subunit RicT [Edaphocola sp.]